MKLGFEEEQAPFISGSQNARVWTERWVADWSFCPNCGCPKLDQFSANQPVADFYCPECGDEFELKSQKKVFGKKLANGAYATKINRLNASNNPNLILLHYDEPLKQVKNVLFVPKHYFTANIVEKRKPLGPNAHRAGWVGSNILLEKIPQSGRIFYVKEKVEIPRETVCKQWQQNLFLRNTSNDKKGWLLDVMSCIEEISSQEFNLQQVYQFEKKLAELYPENQNIRPKIRQQLQYLRDQGYLHFLGNGQYLKR